MRHRFLRDRAAIAGVGETEYSRNSGMSHVALLLQAAVRAIEDAGLRPGEAVFEDITGDITMPRFKKADAATVQRISGEQAALPQNRA